MPFEEGRIYLRGIPLDYAEAVGLWSIGSASACLTSVWKDIFTGKVSSCMGSPAVSHALTAVIPCSSEKKFGYEARAKQAEYMMGRLYAPPLFESAL